VVVKILILTNIGFPLVKIVCREGLLVNLKNLLTFVKIKYSELWPLLIFHQLLVSFGLLLLK